MICMQPGYWQKRAHETRKFRYKSDEVMYRIFKDDDKNPHPDEMGVWFGENIFISDKVPDPFRDMIAYHEWTEVKGMKEHGFPETGTQEGNRLLEMLHKKAAKKELELASRRNVLSQYKEWCAKIDGLYGSRVQ